MTSPDKQVSTRQLALILTIEKEVEIDGIGMGVLSDGTAFLTGRGLARMCGVDHMVIQRLTSGWATEPARPREAKIKETLRQQGLVYDSPCIPILVDGVTHFAYPDPVCMAVLEYYAFDATSASNEQALKNYRLLARRSFRDFIYTQTGYSAHVEIPLAWRQFHDRVSLVYDSVPAGYFSIFKEMADIIVTLISSGAPIGSKFIPDISVGVHWAKWWKDHRLAHKHGERKPYLHHYPDYFPQSASNPQKPYCYPDAALGDFRQWMREVYLPAHFPDYLATKSRQGALPPSWAEMALRAIEAKSDRTSIR